MIKLLSSLTPASIGAKLIAIGLAALVIVGVIFAGYRHIENNRAALIQQTTIAAQAQVSKDLAEQSSELVRQSAARVSDGLSTLSATDEKIDEKIDAKIEAVDLPPPAPAPITEDQSHVAVQTPSSSHLSAAAAAIAALNSSSDAADRLLERASRGTASTHR
jgi:hypothetical protein